MATDPVFYIDVKSSKYTDEEFFGVWNNLETACYVLYYFKNESIEFGKLESLKYRKIDINNKEMECGIHKIDAIRKIAEAYIKVY
jgi:hypothetical protein